MNTFAKLNLKEQNDIVIVNAPESLEREIASLKGVTVRRSMSDVKQVDFSLSFVTKQKEVDALAITVGRKAAGNAIIWIAYPKKSSDADAHQHAIERHQDAGLGAICLSDQGFGCFEQSCSTLLCCFTVLLRSSTMVQACLGCQ